MPLVMNNEIVERVDTFKYSGVYLDKDWTYDFHLEKLYKNMLKRWPIEEGYVPNWPFHGINPLQEIGPAALDYCDIVYATAKQEFLPKLQLVQNVACRTILLANKYANISNIHDGLGLSELDNQRKFHFGNLCHKHIFTGEIQSGITILKIL